MRIDWSSIDEAPEEIRALLNEHGQIARDCLLMAGFKIKNGAWIGNLDELDQVNIMISAAYLREMAMITNDQPPHPLPELPASALAQSVSKRT